MTNFVGRREQYKQFQYLLWTLRGIQVINVGHCGFRDGRRSYCGHPRQHEAPPRVGGLCSCRHRLLQVHRGPYRQLAAATGGGRGRLRGDGAAKEGGGHGHGWCHWIWELIGNLITSVYVFACVLILWLIVYYVTLIYRSWELGFHAKLHYSFILSGKVRWLHLFCATFDRISKLD